MKSRVIIDPLNLTGATRQLLSAYLSRCSVDGELLQKNKTYWLGAQRIVLTRDILIRQKTPHIWHYDVIDDKEFGKGKFGSVYHILAVLKHDITNHNELALQFKQKRVCKYQKVLPTIEYELMRRCQHFRPRGLYKGHPTLISMRKFPGVLLNDALNDERRERAFTHSQRYRITISLLRALQKQIHDNDICHLDIKPDNIYYDPETGEINIFDLGVSQLSGFRIDRRSRGNATFSAPEDFTSVRRQKPINIAEFRANSGIESKATIKADIYSIARVIGLVWRDADPIFFIENADHKKLMLRRITHAWVPQFALFQNLRSVSQNERLAIENQLCKMTAFLPEDRPDLQSCIEYFDLQFLNYKFSKTDPALHEMMIRSHRLALTTLARLDEMEYINNTYNKSVLAINKYKYDLNCPLHHFMHVLGKKYNVNSKLLHQSLNKIIDKMHVDRSHTAKDFFDLMAEQTTIQSLHHYLQNMISDLDDHPAAVTEFLDTLDIRCLAGVKTKSQLHKTVDDIFNDFILHFELLLHALENAEKSANLIVTEDLSHLFQGILEERLNLDNISDITNHIKRKLEKLTAEPHGEPRSAVKRI